MIRRKDQCRKIGYRVRERGLDAGDSVARKENGS
jgi:hypothetical protein